VPLLAVFARLTPDFVYGLMKMTFKPIHGLFYGIAYGIAICEGYRFCLVRARQRPGLTPEPRPSQLVISRS
jgi:hypothetical protein